MLEKILNYLKQTSLYFIAQPISHWVGLLIGAVLSVIIAVLYVEFPFLPHIETEMLFLCVLPYICLFVFIYIVAYKARQFSIISILLYLLPLFIFQHIYLFNFGPSSWINGITANLAFIWFNERETIWSDALIQLGLQFIIHLPLCLAASYLGCRKGIKKYEE